MNIDLSSCTNIFLRWAFEHLAFGLVEVWSLQCVSKKLCGIVRSYMNTNKFPLMDMMFFGSDDWHPQWRAFHERVMKELGFYMGGSTVLAFALLGLTHDVGLGEDLILLYDDINDRECVLRETKKIIEIASETIGVGTIDNIEASYTCTKVSILCESESSGDWFFDVYFFRKSSYNKIINVCGHNYRWDIMRNLVNWDCDKNAYQIRVIHPSNLIDRRVHIFPDVQQVIRTDLYCWEEYGLINDNDIIEKYLPRAKKLKW